VSYLRDIAVFVRVVDLKGFAAAGRALGLTAPSVSKQIARLEAELGVALLHRTTHNLFLTDAGREFYERCVTGLAELELARATALSFNDELRGKLRVHCTLAVGQAMIAPAMVRFMATHPDIRIDLEMSSMPINPMELQVDVAIRTKTPRETSPGHVSIGRRILGKVRHVLVASPAYLARKGRPQRIEDIRERDCLVYFTYSTFSESWLFHDGRQEVTLKIDEPILRSNNWMVVREAALGGIGLARLPEFVVEHDVAAGRLVSLLEDQVRSDLQVQAVFPRTQRMPAKTRLLLDFLAQRLSGNEARRRGDGEAEPVAIPVPVAPRSTPDTAEPRIRADKARAERKARTV
jgi:DNA-binding transcriptional LysR family regulator